MTKVSVIIPAHNEEKYIENTLKSLKKNTFKDKEVIVVANGCNDKTVDFAVKHADKLLVLPEPNVSKARNFGAKYAKGDLLVFVDADILLEKDALKEIVESGAKLGTIKMRPDTNKKMDYLVQSIRNIVNRKGFVSGVLFCTKENFLNNGGFDENKKIREFKPLIKKLKQVDKFKMVNVYGVNSYRRFRDQGYLKNILFWLSYVAGKEKGYKPIR